MAWGLELFQTKGLHWWHHVVPGESHVTVAYRSVHDGLREIFREYAVPPPIVLTGDLPGLEAHLARASGIYGYEVEAPEGLLNSMGYVRLGYFDDVEGAISNFRRYVELHPASANAYNGLADALEAAGEFEDALSNREEAVRLAEQTGDERLEDFLRKRDALREREE